MHYIHTSVVVISLLTRSWREMRFNFLSSPFPHAPLSLALFHHLNGLLAHLPKHRRSLHPDVPGDQKYWTGTAEKSKLFFLTLFAPEIIVALAFRQFWLAKNLTKIQAFFLVMGGFTTAAGSTIMTTSEIERDGILEGIQI
ncbi:hypothetical protein C8R47DRAFT_1328107 [Mycena vitilis]|nr:hypothetical protein C8R47DRAFT_1328107 [Mycena vitilis]